MPVLRLETEIIYGPLISRRLGRSLGVNLLPIGRKVCSFNCTYCHYGATDECSLAPCPEGFPTLEQVLEGVERALRRYRYVDTLTFSGNGEPTLHPQFTEIIAEVRRLRDHISPSIKLAIFSNATTASRPSVREALAAFDTPMMKLDAGDSATLAQVNHPCTGATIEGVTGALRGLPRLIVQSVLVGGPVSNASGAAHEAWVAALADLRPAQLQIASTDYPVPSTAVHRVPPAELRRIAEDVHARTGIAAEAYWR